MDGVVFPHIMSLLRLLLLSQILFSLAVLVGLGFAMTKVRVAQTLAVDFESSRARHAVAMTSENPDGLRNHAEELWAMSQHANAAAESFLSSTKLALRVAILSAGFTLVICTAAFIKAKPETLDGMLKRP
jgi:hypothetical protein